MKQILTEQFLRMQKLAGILTENQYKEKLDELSDAIKDAGLEEFIDKLREKFINRTITEYEYYEFDYSLILEEDTYTIDPENIHLNNNGYFAIKTALDVFIYNYNKKENRGDDSFTIDDGIFGVDEATAKLLVEFAQTINPQSKLTFDNIKVKDRHDELPYLPVLGTHFNQKDEYEHKGEEVMVTIRDKNKNA